MDAIPLLFVDDDLAVVEKPPGVLVVPAEGRNAPTLVDRLSRQLGRRVFAVHRLDEATTGCLCVAFTEAGRSGLEDAFRRHAPQRDYLALLSAVPNPVAGCIEASLHEGPDGVVRVVPRGGRRAVTHYRMLGRRNRGCLVLCRLETGRRNQIRAHFAALGCPLAGDRKYGYRSRPGESFSRVMLHSWRLAFDHPISGSRIAVVSEPPEAELRPLVDET